MTTIAHISDLHFTCTIPKLVSRLRTALEEARPRLLVVSGDLTQRARRKQFAAARDFIQSLPHSMIVVPGNHDVPLWDVARRFLAPTGRYRQYICDDLMPMYHDEDLFVVGTNSTRAFTLDPRGFWKNGTLSDRQLDEVRQRFALAKPHMLKVLVMHHPLVNPWNQGSRDTARGRRRIARALQDIGVNVVLSGHLHRSYVAPAPVDGTDGRPLLCIQAGTACSTRLRGETNAFNLIQWDSGKLSMTVMRFDGERYAPEATRELRRACAGT